MHTCVRTHTEGNIKHWRTESISKYPNCAPSKCPRTDTRATFSWNMFPKDSEHNVTSAQSSGSHNSTWGVYTPSDHLCNIPSLPQGVEWGRQRRNGGFPGWGSSSLSLVSSVRAFFVFFFANKSPHFTSFSGSFYWQCVDLVRMNCMISPVSDIHKALFISSLFFLRRKLRTLLIFSAFFIYIYALSIQKFPLQLLCIREVFWIIHIPFKRNRKWKKI